MDAKKRLLYILIGPSILILTVLGLSGVLTTPGAQAAGILFWMIFWWVTRPVHIAVTAFLPVVMNAILNIIPMEVITAQYAADSIILIFGAGLLCLPWAAIGLDKRIALKALSIIGPSMKSQITVWLLTSVLLSMALPNVAVCALLTAIAVAMLKAVGYKDIATAAPAAPILLCIGWGVGLGGAGTPLGGAMNLVAISLLEEHTGQEFMYIDWVLRIAPYFIIATIILLTYMLLMPLKVKTLEGSKDYFKDNYKALGSMKRDEKICATLFVLAVLGAFTRPLFADLVPALTPAYIFLILGSLAFVITAANKKALLTWETTEKGTMWGMMILFGGGLAIGRLINDSGASQRLAEIVSGWSLDGGFLTIVVFVVLARVMSELTNSTASAAVCVPIILGFTTQLGLNPIPYWFIITMAYNAEYLLPISVRAIPVSHGLDANLMLKRGLPITTISTVFVIIFGYIALNYWPFFSQLSY